MADLPGDEQQLGATAGGDDDEVEKKIREVTKWSIVGLPAGLWS